MSSPRDPNDPFEESNGDGTPTYNKPWPIVDPFIQGHFERMWLADGETIDFDRVPKLQFWTPWAGVSDATRVVLVMRNVIDHSKGARRPLTGIEATAIGEHTAASLRKFAWEHPVAFGCTAAATFAGRRTFRFPLYQPKKLDPLYFPMKRMPLLRGGAATAAWHMARFCAYFPVVWIPTLIVFASMATSSFGAHATRDSRLAPLLQEIRQNNKHLIEQQSRRRAGISNPAGTKSSQDTQQMGDGAYQDDQTSQEHRSTNYTTKSNTNFERPSSATESPQTAYPSWPRNASTQPAPYRAQENTSPGPSSRREDDDSGLFEDDDASPIAPSARTRQVPSNSSGSSWDRIRQQAKSGSPNWEMGDSSGQERGWAQMRQDKTQNPKDTNPKTDSYSYSDADEEKERRNYEKEQAQKEFDALVEAERGGGGSSGSSGSSRGWRR
ncbi:hypothetical protein F4803DRAFT_37566 [Xylaria telfairii]|nr:hypothetical protein F4803DRAFT_37566 [Xylaria telfairii]